VEELKQAIRSGAAHRWLVVVPRGIAMTRLRRKLVDELGYLFGLRITTLHALIDGLASRILEPIPRLISPVAAEEAIGKIASRLPQPALAKLLSKQSAQRAALTTIRELKTVGVDRRFLADSGIDKLESIAALWEAYDRFCTQNGLIDPADRELDVIKAVEAGAASDLGFDNLLISGFVSIPPHYERFLKALSAGCRLHLLLPSDGGKTDLFLRNAALLDRASDWAADTRADESTFGEGAAGELQRRLFAPPAGPMLHDPERIKISAAPRRYDEVEHAGSRIIELLEKGVEPGRIGVTVRDISDYDEFIRDVFKRLAISFHYRRGIPILQAPPVRLAMKLTDLGGRRVRYDELIGVLRSPYLKLPDAEESADLIIEAKQYTEKPERWVKRLSGVRRKEDGSSPNEEALTALNRLLANCLSIRREKDGSLKKLKANAESYIQLPEGDDSETSLRDKQGWSRFIEIIDDLIDQTDDLHRLGLVPLADPLERLRERLREEMIPAYRNPADSVYVLNFFDMGYVDIDYLFVLGMDEGSVPGNVHRSDTLLSESEIRLLRERRIEGASDLLDTADLRRSEEQAFLLAIRSANKRIEFSFPQLKADGKETTPSSYLGEIQAILGIQDQEPDVLPGGDIRRMEQVPPYRLAMRRQIARRLFRSDLPETDSLTASIYNRLLAMPGEADFIRHLMEVYKIEEQRLRALFNSSDGRRAVANRYCGRIESPDLQRWIADEFGLEYRWSVKSLEKMGVCPFDFFLTYCLSLKELELPEEEPRAMDEGNLLHRIAGEFVQKTIYPIADIKPAWEKLSSIIERQFERLYPGSREELPLPSMVMRQRIEGFMRRFLEYEAKVSDRKPRLFEHPFGSSKTPLVIRVESGNIMLTGRFDRVDESSDPLVSRFVIDYKRSEGETSFSKSLKGHMLQMPIYIFAAGCVFGIPLEKIKGGFYGFRSGELKEIDPKAADVYRDWLYFFGLSHEPFHKCPAYDEVQPKRLIELIEELVTQARQAYFPIEGRNEAQVPDLANLVGRWLEMPPEFEAGGGE
jgi:ATP-dependent helicase/DNAse subunit B